MSDDSLIRFLKIERRKPKISADQYQTLLLNEAPHFIARRNAYRPETGPTVPPSGANQTELLAEQTPRQLHALFPQQDALEAAEFIWGAGRFKPTLDDVITAIRAGNIVALLDWLDTSLNQHPLPPSICLKQTLRYILTLVKDRGGQKRGRLASPASECREDLKHFVRCDLLNLVRMYQARWKQMGRNHGRLKVRGGRRFDPSCPGTSFRAAFAFTSWLTRGTSFAATPDQIKKSYQKIQRDKVFRAKFYLPFEFRSPQRSPNIWSAKMGKEYARLTEQIRTLGQGIVTVTDSTENGDQRNGRAGRRATQDAKGSRGSEH